MTKRDFFNSVLNAHVTPEIDAYCEDAIAMLDKTNSKRRSTATAKRAEVNDPLKAVLVGMLTSEPQPASELGVKAEITTAKASALLRALVNDGKAQTVEIKGKHGKVKGYFC